MPSVYDLIQKDGSANSGGLVTNYTVKPPTPAQPQVPNKTPMHSRTQPETYTMKKR